MDVILLFSSNSGTMVATKTLRDFGVQVKMIPTPRAAQSATNLCLSVDHEVEAAALAALKLANVSVSTIVR
jgi:putative Se/S carrier protein